MKKVNITEDMRASIGGIFHQDTLIFHETVEEAIEEDVDISTERDLRTIIEFCDILLDKDLTPQERRKHWVDAADEGWIFTHDGLIEVLEYMRKVMSDELHRRFP